MDAPDISDRELIRDYGYGPEYREFPVRMGQAVFRDDRTGNGPVPETVCGIDARPDGICLWTAPYGDHAAGSDTKGEPLWLGVQGNVYARSDAICAARDWFYENGGDMPHKAFSLGSARPLFPPPAPYFTGLSAIVLSTWYFGTVRMAPARPGNGPYRSFEELEAHAAGRFLWVEDLAAEREMLCMVTRSSALSRRCDTAVACSLYYPCQFDFSDYFERSWDGRMKGTWIARPRPK